MATQTIAPSVKTVFNVPPVSQAFGELTSPLAGAMEAVTLTNSYPAGAVLFAEGQASRGIFVVVRGRVKLSVCARDGRTLILRIAEAGEVLGAASAVVGREYEATAEVQDPAEVGFLRQSALARLMRQSGEFALWITQQISHDYNATCREIRDLMLSDSASERLARLLVGWLDHHAEAGHPSRMKLGLTHEEIAQMIGTSRETVTRLFAGFKKQHLIQQNGATLVVPNRAALESLIST